MIVPARGVRSSGVVADEEGAETEAAGNEDELVVSDDGLGATAALAGVCGIKDASGLLAPCPSTGAVSTVWLAT